MQKQLKPFFTILFLLIINQTVYSQDAENGSFKMREYYPNGNIKAEYWLKVFNSDTLIHGNYTMFSEKGKIIETSMWAKGRIVGIREIFDKKGRVLFRETYQEGEYPRTIISQAYYYEFLAGCKTSIGKYIETGFMEKQPHGDVRYIRKNGNLMDSLVFENGVNIYRARFNSKGKLILEERIGHPD
jgi:antitoxin component YwqK of YwqJK toxin-antitoxin module